MVVVMIVPTGIGCAIGGHSGDAAPAAKLLAGVCDTLVVHPNVVNAADINEMPENAFYVEGSMLDRFLAGKIKLRRVRSNRILVVCNEMTPTLKNAVKAAYYSAGIDCNVATLDAPLRMQGWVNANTGRADGSVDGLSQLVEQVKEAVQRSTDDNHWQPFGAIAIYTPVEVENPKDYAVHGGINPYGFVEAVVSRAVSKATDLPAAHAPLPDVDDEVEIFPRLAAEGISASNLFCVLKGLHRAPQIADNGMSVNDVDYLVSPAGCRGTPHLLCEENGVPVLVVRENATSLNRPVKGVEVDNYLEAAGYLAAVRTGVTPGSVRA